MSLMCCDNEGRHSCSSPGFLAWAGSWILFPIAPVISLVLGGVSFFQSFGSGARLTRSTLLTPFVIVPVFFIFQGAADYTSGHAVLHRNAAAFTRCESRYLSSDWDVDPRTRLPYMETPCGFGSLFTHRAYNRTVIFLSRKFGPQRGAYRGRFPSLSEARNALAKGQLAVAADLERHPDLQAFLAVESPDRDDGFFCGGYPPAATDVRLRVGRLGETVVIGNPFGVMLYEASSGREIARHGDPRVPPSR